MIILQIILIKIKNYLDSIIWIFLIKMLNYLNITLTFLNLIVISKIVIDVIQIELN